MLANLLPDTAHNLHTFSLSAFRVRKSQQTITILRIGVEEHWTAEMRNLQSLEERLPFRQPFLAGAVKDQHRG